MDAFEKAFRQRYLKEFRDARQLEPDRIRRALLSGVYTGGSREWPCEFEVNQATNPLLHQIRDFIQQKARGTMRYDTIVLTSGDAARAPPGAPGRTSAG
jgi:hypothetical protein